TLGTFANGNPFMALGTRLLYAFQKNTVKGSRKNIQAHYDLGNDFYKLWLDPTMTYSSALYKTEGEELAQAQLNKYDRIVDRLDRGSGSILEIGCGWGGFADRAAERGDFGIKGITLSDEQHAYAQQRLDGRADIVIEDYRHQKNKFDHIVSIEMFEAVGEQYWPTYFGKVKDLLAEKGNAVIQTITISEQFFDNYRKGTDFIRSFIFPGGMLPSPTRFKEEAQKVGLQVTDSFSFGHDYSTTLLEWMETFDQKKLEVLNLGFDEGFIKIWRFYLAGCAAAFSSERTDVMQIELRHS
ncbi:cyclopropane-fatty-acyl-phospholipid synthase family protein, partial [Alphaproteobacteria bacterium]|nr:cyclopropane-fatty-acyl-phospholipid synthase family protein [Alphaproteobacteria bacterium]